MSFTLDPDRDDDLAAERADHTRLLADIDHDLRVPMVEHCPVHGTWTHEALMAECPACLDLEYADRANRNAARDALYDLRNTSGG